MNSEFGITLKEMRDKQSVPLHIVGGLNKLYSFLASVPAFDTVDGTRKYCVL